MNVNGHDAAGPTNGIYLAIAVVATAFAVVGFSRSFYVRPVFADTALPGLLHLHGLVFSAWLVLFLSQASLVTAGRRRLHRRLGLGGVALAVVMVAIGVVTIVTRGRVHPDPPMLYAVALGDLGLFAGFFALAVARRRVPDVHRRLMVLALVATVGAGVGRWPIVTPLFDDRTQWMLATFLLTQTLLVAGIVSDWLTRGRVHAAYVWGGLVLVAVQGGRIWLVQTAAWSAFVTGIR